MYIEISHIYVHTCILYILYIHAYLHVSTYKKEGPTCKMHKIFVYLRTCDSTSLVPVPAAVNIQTILLIHRLDS